MAKRHLKVAGDLGRVIYMVRGTVFKMRIRRIGADIFPGT